MGIVNNKIRFSKGAYCVLYNSKKYGNVNLQIIKKCINILIVKKIFHVLVNSFFENRKSFFLFIKIGCFFSKITIIASFSKSKNTQNLLC